MPTFINIGFCTSDYKLLKNMALGDPRIREFTSLVEWNIISCKGLRPLFMLMLYVHIQSFKLCCLLLFKIKKVEILQKSEVNKSRHYLGKYASMPYMAKWISDS